MLVRPVCWPQGAIGGNTLVHSIDRACAMSIVMPVRLPQVRATAGVGGADPSRGGMSGMRDRIRALGGELGVCSDLLAGTVITAWLPCG